MHWLEVPHALPPLLAHSRMWYCLPLIVSICLVYGATRHELMPQILDHSVRFCVWMITFMFTIFAITFLLSWLV